MGRFIKPDKEETKRDFAAFKRDFQIAIKDKKRWINCLIELLIAAVLIVIDQLEKIYIYGHCRDVGDIIIIDGVIRFTAVENTGASFGMFSSSTAALTAVSFICSVILIAFIFYSYPRRSKWLRSALVMLTAGALGNVIDRMALGYVRDMVYFELIDFAVFNFADNCLCIGTAVLIIYILFFYTKDEEAARKLRQESEQASVPENTESVLLTEESSVEESSVEAPIESAVSSDENEDGKE